MKIEIASSPILSPGCNPAFRIAAQIEKKTCNLIVEVGTNGEPRFAQQAVNQIFRCRSEFPGDYPIFIAPYISPRSAAICLEADIGYIDFAGNCHLSFQNIYVHKEGKPNPYTNKRYVKSLYSPKAERILRVLLMSGPREWKVDELAKEASVSLGQVSNIKKLLADREWIKSQSVGFALSKPYELLEEWSQNYNYRRNKISEFYTTRSSGDIEISLERFCREEKRRFGLTSISGAAHFPPTARYQRMVAYVKGNVNEIISKFDLEPVSSGANVTLLEPYDEGVFYGSQSRGGAEVVSPIQIYLDLKNFGELGQKAADAIFDFVIRNLW
ncbi:MAG: hypothetical protein KAJ19_12515 [Gammaproteobacteria bacterium]|nr:hypothetical protein [Gammaproteobacteria bacterium]